MSYSINSENLHSIANHYGVIDRIKYSSKHDEIFLKCEEALIVLSGQINIFFTRKLTLEDKIISAVRLDNCWEVLIDNGGFFSLLQLTQENSRSISFENNSNNYKSAIWSPCGKFIAVGSKHSPSLTVLDKEKGEIKWIKNLELVTEGELISRPSLSVVDWSSCGQKIITYAEYISALTTIIWDAENGKIDSIID